MREASNLTTGILCIKTRRRTPFGGDYLQNVQLISPQERLLMLIAGEIYQKNESNKIT
jgi:hypothetical protein